MISPGIVAMLMTSAVVMAGQTPPRSGEAFQVNPEATEAIGQIWSPYCPGLMLEVCSSSGGAMLRDSIQRMAERGASADSIVEIVIADYGEEWRAEPLRSGTGLWAWIMPPIALVAGLGTVGAALARRGRHAVRPDLGLVDPAVEARLQEALRDLDKEEMPDW